MIREVFNGGGGNTSLPPSYHGCVVNTVIVVYILVQNNPLFVHFATRFVETYRAFPSDSSHRLLVCCNGGLKSSKIKPLFDGVGCDFLDRKYDDGWDISAYQEVAQNFPCDLLVCFGESVRFHREGWLKRLVESAREYGEGMYGCLSSHAIRAHLNTTAFAVSPRFLREYPAVRNKGERYEFEHGEKAMWRRIKSKGGSTRLVTWDGCWGPGDWRKPANILWRGNQSNCLVHCNHHDKWEGANEPLRQGWSRMADSPFK